MPNIILNSNCNLNCIYCFAKNQKANDITIKQFINILDWLKESNIKQDIGLIGGEPTLHPQISLLLDIANQYKNTYTIFTNGIYINKIINHITKNIHLLININSLEKMPIQKNQLEQNLNILFEKNLFYSNIRLGCNICQNIDDYSFFWNLIDKYNPKIIRVSTVAPTAQQEFINKEKYYLSLKEKFLNFLYNAKDRNIELKYDCNKIPLCYFTKKEINDILTSTNDLYNQLCFPVIDIFPNFTATSCFGTYDPIDCSQFKTFNQLYNYFVYKENVPLTLANTQGKCAICKEHELLKCQGGCLAFAKNNKEE